MVDEPISDCGCLLCPCLRPGFMRPRRPRISLVRVHQHLGFGPQASEAHEASTSTNSCNTFVVYNRPGPMKRGCPRMLASGAQDTSAPTNPRVGIWGSVHDTPCLLSGRLPLRFFTCWMACLNIIFFILRKYHAYAASCGPRPSGCTTTVNFARFVAGSSNDEPE